MILVLTGLLLLLVLAPPWLKALVLGVAAYYGWKRHETLRTLTRRPRTGAGASSLARAEELRTPLVRLATAAGISTKAARLADRCEAGAAGERHIARLLAELATDGWTVLADRALPASNANVDFVVISPRGNTYNVDAKNWNADHPLTADRGRLLHGTRDVTHRLRGLTWETRTLTSLLGVPVHSIAAVIGPLPAGAQLRVDGVRIIPAADLCTVLRRIDRETLPQQRAARLVDTAGRLLPPKTGR